MVKLHDLPAEHILMPAPSRVAGGFAGRESATLGNQPSVGFQLHLRICGRLN
jgi:hypothetical protein